MPRLLNLLVIFSVLWCGLHLMEPAGTVAGLVDLAHAEAVHADGPANDCDGDAGKVAHSGHHHCPVAPDQRAPALAAVPYPATTPLFARQPGALASLAQAPPLQPPTA